MDRNLMEKFRKTLEMLEGCRSKEDALKVLETVTEQADENFILPVTQERVKEIVAEFERDLRQGRIPSTVSLSPELKTLLNDFLNKIQVACDESDSSCESAEPQTFQRQNSREEIETKMLIGFLYGLKSFYVDFRKNRGANYSPGVDIGVHYTKYALGPIHKAVISKLGKTNVQVPALEDTDLGPSDIIIENEVTQPEGTLPSALQGAVMDPSDIKKEIAEKSPQMEEPGLQVTLRDQSELKTCTDILIEDAGTSPQREETEADFIDLDLKHSMPKTRVLKDDNALERITQTICVEFHPYNWYLINCATEFLLLSFHVMFADSSWIKEVLDAGGDLKNEQIKHRDFCKAFSCWGKLNCRCGVDLNCTDGRVGKVGNVNTAVIQFGQQQDLNDIQSNPTSGMEIVLIKMDRPLAVKSLRLPELLYKRWKDLGLPKALYFKGKVLEYMECPLELPVYKMGKSTGLTMGRVERKNDRCTFMDGMLPLENQLKIRWEKDRPFSTEGDSGSLVFCVKKEQDIYSVGILTGSDSKSFSVVTPMSEILKYLGSKYRLREFMYEEVNGGLIFRVTD